MSEEPYCTILEHSLYGDLYHYLRQISKIVGPTTKSSPTAGKVIKYHVGLSLKMIIHERYIFGSVL